MLLKTFDVYKREKKMSGKTQWLAVASKMLEVLQRRLLRAAPLSVEG